MKQKFLGNILHTGGICYLDKLSSVISILSDITQVIFWPISFSSKNRSSNNLILEEELDFDVRIQALPLKGNSALLTFSSSHNEKIDLEWNFRVYCPLWYTPEILPRWALIVIKGTSSGDIFQEPAFAICNVINYLKIDVFSKSHKQFLLNT